MKLYIFLMIFFLISTTNCLKLFGQFSNGNHQMCSSQVSVRDGQLGIGSDDRPYFIGTDNKVHNLYWSGTSWQDAILNNNAPLAVSGSGLAFYLYEPGSSTAYEHIAYATTNNLLYSIVYNNGWQYYSLGVTAMANSVLATKPTSKLQYISYDGKINNYSCDAKGQALFPIDNDYNCYFVGSDSKVKKLTYVPPYTLTTVNNNATVLNNTEIVYYDGWIFYINNNNKVAIQSSDNNWEMSFSADAIASCGMAYGYNRIFYVDNNYRIRYLLWDGYNWLSSGPIGTQVKPSTKFAFKNNRL